MARGLARARARCRSLRAESRPGPRRHGPRDGPPAHTDDRSGRHHHFGRRHRHDLDIDIDDHHDHRQGLRGAGPRFGGRTRRERRTRPLADLRARRPHDREHPVRSPRGHHGEPSRTRRRRAARPRPRRPRPWRACRKRHDRSRAQLGCGAPGGRSAARRGADSGADPRRRLLPHHRRPRTAGGCHHAQGLREHPPQQRYRCTESRGYR